MKKYLIILLIFLTASPAYALDLFGHKQLANATMGQLMASGKTAAASGTSYFGYQNDKTEPAGLTYSQNNTGNEFDVYKASFHQYTGTTGTLKELCGHARKNTQDSTMRIAIYDNSGNLVAKGSADITINSATPQWWCHTTFTDASDAPVTPTISNGTYYRIADATADGQVFLGYVAGTSGDMGYNVSYGPSTMPDAVPSLTNSSRHRAIIAGVQY